MLDHVLNASTLVDVWLLAVGLEDAIEREALRLGRAMIGAATRRIRVHTEKLACDEGTYLMLFA